MVFLPARLRSPHTLSIVPFSFVAASKNYRTVAMSSETQPGSVKPARNGNDKTAAKSTAPTAKTDLKILMLHGYTQSGPLFSNKTGSLKKQLIKALGIAPLNYNPVFVYPTAPMNLRPSDIPGFQPPEGKTLADLDAEETDNWGWFRFNSTTGTYDGFAAGMRRIAAAVREAGGVDAVLGFSQGGAMAAWVAAALEPGRALPPGPPAAAPSGDDEEREDRAWAQELREANAGRPLRAAVVYSGFVVARDSAAARRLEWLYAGDIQTPTLHFMGGLDTVVAESRSRGLVERCRADRTRVVMHPGGHYVPVSKEWTNALLVWLREVLQQQQQQQQGEEQQDKKEEESV